MILKKWQGLLQHAVLYPPPPPNSLFKKKMKKKLREKLTLRNKNYIFIMYIDRGSYLSFVQKFDGNLKLKLIFLKFIILSFFYISLIYSCMCLCFFNFFYTLPIFMNFWNFLFFEKSKLNTFLIIFHFSHYKMDIFQWNFNMLCIIYYRI